jgi:2-hydroxy-6-oxonona-2,4-dienedioate hydrolase
MSLDTSSEPREPTSFWLSLQGCEYSVNWETIDGVRSRLIQAGERTAPVVVCLHGTGGHAEAFVRNIALLSRSFRVVAYDLPAHGWSDAPERSYEIDGYISHLMALLNHLGIQRASFVGQSLGGWIAARLALSSPTLVDRLVLVAPGGAASDPVVMERIRESSMAAATGSSWQAVANRVTWIWGDSKTVPQELVACRYAMYHQATSAARMQKVLTLQDPLVRQRNTINDADWGRLSQTTLLVWGDRDEVVPVSVGERLDRLIPSASLLLLRGAGHWPQFEQAAAFNTALMDFLEGQQ